MAFSLRARIVFPVDRPAIEHGIVTIEGERIVAVGTAVESSELIDLGDVALLPGLINAHTHLEFSHLRRPLGTPGMALPDWIRLVITERGRGDSPAAGAFADGTAECLAHGTTTICDISTADSPVGAENPESLTLLEVIGFSRARAGSSLSRLIERLDLAKVEPERRAFGISPHAPYTVSPMLLGQLIDLAVARSLPVGMHLAESREELDFLATGSGPFQAILDQRSMWDAEAVPLGSRPLDYLQMLAAAPRSLVIHGNYLNADELSFLAANRDRMSLVYCPRTHAFFRHSKYPLAEALSAGVRVALGTDSRASNPDLNLLAEMRFAAKSFPDVDPHEILRTGTLSGAEALGFAANAGSITPGKCANLVPVPLPDEPSENSSSCLRSLLADDRPLTDVWLHGRKITNE